MSPRLRELFTFGSAPRLPDDVRRALGRERALAACRAADGTWLVGSADRLHVVGDQPMSLPWQQVHRADWDEETRRFVIVPVADFGRPVAERGFVLDDGAADLLPLVRERVSASILLQTRVAVSGKRGFQVFGRRPPRGGAVTWAFELDEGVDPDDPAVRAAMDQALHEARGHLGQQDG